MSSVYKRKDSPFWWVGYTDEGGARRLLSTNIKVSDSGAYRRALEFASNLKAKERSTIGKGDGWDNWVPRFLAGRYTSTLSRNRVNLVWRTLRTWLNENAICHPGQLARAHCFEFMDWRKSIGMFKGKGINPVCHNTALYELKTLNMIMNEAVNRGIVTSNPCARLKIPKEDPKVKDEFTNEQLKLVLDLIDAKLAKAVAGGNQLEIDRADFLYVSAQIAMHQSCRMCETHFPLARVDFTNKAITYKAKGQTTETKRLNSVLIPLLKKLAAEGREFTYKKPRLPSLIWWKFFDEIRRKHPGFSNLSFHSLRVSGISRMERAGIPQSVVMKLVNHSSATTNRIYRRVTSPENDSAWAALASTYSPCLGETHSSQATPEPLTPSS